MPDLLASDQALPLGWGGEKLGLIGLNPPVYPLPISLTVEVSLSQPRTGRNRLAWWR
jgi:hypothetical protein